MKKIFLIVFLLIITKLNAQETLKFTLEDCVRYAEQNNYSLQNAGLDLSSSEINLKKAKLLIAPTVSASATQGYAYQHNSSDGGSEWTGNYGISAGMTLFNGLNTFQTIKQSKLNVSQSKLLIEKAKNSLNLEIIQNFLSVVMNKELLIYQTDVVNTSAEQLKQGEDKFKVGSILESDFLMLQAQHTSNLMNIENTKLNIENGLSALRKNLSLKSSQQLEIINPDTAVLRALIMLPSQDYVLLKTFDYLPELKIASNSVESAQYDVKIAKSNYYPSLDMNAGISTGYSNFDESFSTQLGNRLGENVGLSLNIPIYKQSTARTQVKLAKIQVQQAQIDQQQTELNATEEVTQQYILVSKSLNNYKSSEVQERAYYANYMAYNKKFEYGAITAADLLQQQNNYLNYLNNYMQNKYTFILQRKILDIYMGIPIQL